MLEGMTPTDGNRETRKPAPHPDVSCGLTPVTLAQESSARRKDQTPEGEERGAGLICWPWAGLLKIQGTTKPQGGGLRE